jgi:hypothetical protein
MLEFTKFKALFDCGDDMYTSQIKEMTNFQLEINPCWIMYFVIHYEPRNVLVLVAAYLCNGGLIR